MTISECYPFPSYDLNVDPARNAFSKVGTAIDHRNYTEAVEFASIALREIQELHLITVLDHRAYALGKQGKFDDAVKDAQDMISCKPTLATGYIRLGDLYQMQGKQQKAMETYAAGQQSIPKQDPLYSHMADGWESAKMQSRKRLDVVGRLPSEIVQEIITLLPSDFKSVWLEVSDTWNKKVLSYSGAWTVLSGDDINDYQAQSVIPHIAAHVEDLTIGTGNEQLWTEYLLNMRDKRFSKINSLCLTVATTSHIRDSALVSTMIALAHMDITLTKLDLDFVVRYTTTVTVADVLIACPSLKCLVYKTTSPCKEAIGNIALLRAHHALVDLQIKALSISGSEIMPLLQQCQELQRLAISGGNSTVLDIADIASPKLKVLGYNNLDTHPISSLSQHLSNNRQNVSGLQTFYTKNGGGAEPATAVLPIIQRNMESLETLYINIAAQNYDDIQLRYEGLTLNRLTKLTFWSDRSEKIQRLIMRSISNCTELSSLTVVGLCNVSDLVNGLIAMPRLSFLELSHVSGSFGSTDLIRLFDAYAADTRSERAFERASFRYCDAVTDDVLSALANIRALNNVQLTHLNNVSSLGMDTFFKKSGNSTTEISLIDMDCITDVELIAVGNMECLKSIHLKDLKSVTDHGLLEMVKLSPQLRRLTIENCNSVTTEAILYAKKKVRGLNN